MSAAALIPTADAGTAITEIPMPWSHHMGTVVAVTPYDDGLPNPRVELHFASGYRTIEGAAARYVFNAKQGEWEYATEAAYRRYRWLSARKAPLTDAQREDLRILSAFVEERRQGATALSERLAALRTR